jgi:hypothetical protein
MKKPIDDKETRQVIVINQHDESITCAAMTFAPVGNLFHYHELGFFKLAQLRHHPKLEYRVEANKQAAEKTLERLTKQFAKQDAAKATATTPEAN